MKGAHPTCTEVLAQVHEYLHRELPQGELGRVRTHLQGCPPCRGEYEVEEVITVLIRRCHQGEEAPARLRMAVLQVTESPERAGPELEGAQSP